MNRSRSVWADFLSYSLSPHPVHFAFWVGVQGGQLAACSHHQTFPPSCCVCSAEMDCPSVSEKSQESFCLLDAFAQVFYHSNSECFNAI